jgi:hypothetical protein
MSPEDVPQPRARPPRRVDTELPHRPTRWTMQYFSDDENTMNWLEERNIVHNRDLWAPEDLSEWPTDSIFDMVYGCNVLKKWGDEKVIQAILEMGSDLVNEEGPLPSPSVDEVRNGHDDEWRGEPESDTMPRMADVLATIWQSSSSGREKESNNRDEVCTLEAQKKVLDWLGLKP